MYDSIKRIVITRLIIASVIGATVAVAANVYAAFPGQAANDVSWRQTKPLSAGHYTSVSEDVTGSITTPVRPLLVKAKQVIAPRAHHGKLNGQSYAQPDATGALRHAHEPKLVLNIFHPREDMRSVQQRYQNTPATIAIVQRLDL